MKLICEIEVAFEITSRGCVVVPGIPYDFSPSIGIGAPILIVSPLGERLETQIAGVEMINRGRPLHHVPFSVPKAIQKHQLSPGSKVFYLGST